MQTPMLTHLLLFIPPLIAYIYAMVRMTGEHIPLRRGIVTLIFVALAIYFTLQDFLDVQGAYPFVYGKLVQTLLMPYVIPAVYLLVSIGLGLNPRETPRLKTLIYMTAVLIPVVTSELLDPQSAADVAGNVPTDNYLYLSFDGVHHLRWNFFSLLITAQVIVCVARFGALAARLRRLELRMTRHSWVVVAFMSVTAVAAAVALLSPPSLWRERVANLAMLSTWCMLITLWLLLLSWGQSEPAVVDKRGAAVSLATDQEALLAESMRSLLENDKVFLRSDLRMEDVAQMLGTNRTYVSHMMRTQFGATLTEVVNLYRVEHAKRLLRQTPQLLIEDVATQSGFATPSFFGRVFKQYTGMTPSEWRRGTK